MLLRELFTEDTISPSDDPNIMSFWHGGDLSDTSMRPQKKGRFEYGAGLYLITKYEVAQKYAKGSRKLYKVDVHKGNDIRNVQLSAEDAKNFVNTYVKRVARQEILDHIDRNIERMGHLNASTFNNIILNSAGIGSKDTVTLSQFLVANGADYELISSPFGWGNAVMMVLYNINKVAKITRVAPKDKITDWDLPGKF
jgi:hypothetical protein